MHLFENERNREISNLLAHSPGLQELGTQSGSATLVTGTSGNTYCLTARLVMSRKLESREVWNQKFRRSDMG